MINRLLIIACVCIVVALVLYLFYWNRFIAFVIGKTVRLLFWNQEGPNIWIEIGSIHFSLLAGRILLKDVRYHSSNQTIKIVKGQVQWRYWIRRPTSEDEVNSSRGGSFKLSASLWSCRIQVTLEGMEWFLYNRTAAFDGILEQAEKASRPTSRSSSHHRLFRRFSRQAEPFSTYPPSIVRTTLQVPGFLKKVWAWLKGQLPSLDPKDLLPLGISVRTGAIILGNPSTTNLLVVEFQNAAGTFGIVPSRSKLDLYKQILNLRFQKITMRFVHNDDYVDPMTSLGEVIHGRIRHSATHRKFSFYQSHRTFAKVWRQMKFYNLVNDYLTTRRVQRGAQPSKSSPPHQNSNETANAETPIGIDFSTFEYALERNILEAPILEFTYYVDVVGEVPSNIPNIEQSGPGVYDIRNGDIAPEWGFDVIIYGGIIRYGPWADRQRAELQRIFFPPTYLDSAVTAVLKPGDKRIWDALRIFVELRDETTLHIPFREASKDWQWDGVTDIPQRPRTREAASIVVDVGDRSSISYVMPMVVGPTGYESTLEVHLDTVSITSSLNDIRLTTAESCRVRCELPTPIRWDAERTWSFAVFLRQPVLFLLRDHVNMFTDLAKDWVSGPPTDYQKFIPMLYLFKLEMYHFELNLYANDQNIVDKPLIREENALITLRGPHMKNTVPIPANQFRPESMLIPFTVESPDLLVDFSLPRWNTHALHSGTDSMRVLQTNRFTVTGSYRYFSEVADDHTDQLKLVFDLDKCSYLAYGWSIRCLMVLRDNYLGSFTHFQTLSEYLDKRKRGRLIGDPLGLKYRPGKSNMLQVEMAFRATSSKIILPIDLVGDAVQKHSAKIDFPDESRRICMTIPEIQLQFRMHDYYMEMSLNIDTISGSILHGSRSPISEQKRCFIIDGIDITANRLFGPQPRTATYVCIWEIAIGNVKTSMSANDIHLVSAAGDTFRLNFVDILNSPADIFLPEIDPDVTFYKITVKRIESVWRAGHAALLLEIPKGLCFDSNDLGAHQYRKVTSIRIPEVRVCVLLTTSMEKNTCLEAFELLFDVYTDIYSSPTGHRALTRKQLSFIEEQDKLTGRARLMFSQLRQRNKTNNLSDHPFHGNGVFLPQPSLPDNNISDLDTVPPILRQPIPARPSSWRISNLPNLSDSDEEGISEADRDARLARTRTSTPAPVTGDDIGMSTGDESDDADLTDSDSVSDSWSDTEDLGNVKATGSLMTFYSPILRHYESHWPGPSGNLEGSPFTVIREKAPFVKDDPEDTSDVAAESLSISDAISKDESVTTYRVRLRRPIEMLYSPLVLSAVPHFEEDLQRVDSIHEVLVDSLMADCLVNAKASKTKCQVVDLHFPALIVRIIQHIPVTEGSHSDGMNPMKSFTVPHGLDMTALLKMSLHTARFVGVFSGHTKPPSMKASVHRGTVTLGVSMDKKTLDSSHLDPTIVDVSLSTTVLEVEQHNLRADLGDLSVSVGNRGPEVVAETLVALASTVTHVSKTLENVRSHQTAVARNKIVDLLQASEHMPVIDALSTIQPSYLVQSGVPQALRTDMTFRFLYHLRNIIRNLRDVDALLFKETSSEPIDSSNFVVLVESRLSLLDQDTPDISKSLLMKSNLFRDQATKQSKEVNHSFDSASIQSRTMTATILAPTGRMSTQLIVKDLGLKIHSRSFDLIQFNFLNSSSASQSSLRSKTSKNIRKMVVLLSVDDIFLDVSPHLMHFAQHILRVKRKFKPSNLWTSKASRGPLDKQFSGLKSFDILGSIQRLRIQAAAENLNLVIGLAKLQTFSSLLASNKGNVQSLNLGVLFDEVYFQARSTSDSTRESDQDILAALVFTTGRITVVSKPEIEPMGNVKLLFALQGIRLHVPRSALRLYHFVGQWRADFLPGMEAAMKTLLSEYNAGPIKPHSPAASRMSRKSPLLQIHGQIIHFEVSLQVMHGTWLSWEVNKTVAYIHSSSSQKADGPYAFGLQNSSMVIAISSKPNARDVAPSSRVKLVLPPISIAGHSDGYNVHTLILFDYIDLKVKPSHWDTLLSVQQKFGQDFNDLVALVQKTRQKGNNTRTHKKPKSQTTTFQYEAHLKMKGFRIGLEGATTTLFLECQDINGGISNSGRWALDVELSNLALSLAPHARGRRDASFNREQRSAFVIIDFKFNGSGSDVDQEKTLGLSVSKVHAVLQPSSIGDLGDFIDNLQTEMMERQEQRSLELATFKEKTERILETFEVNLGDVQAAKTPLISHLLVNISIQNVGIAFPLSHEDELSIRPAKEEPIRAFLFTIKSIQFGTLRGESGQATIQHLCFQFVSRFRQSIPEDFSSDKHHTRNRLLYPRMTAQLRSTRFGAATKFWIKADVDGFILDIDSTVPRYIFSLIDVYRQGKERVDRLSTVVPRTPFTPTPVMDLPSAHDKQSPAIPTSNIFANLTFHSGRVRLYSGSASNSFKAKVLSSTRALEFSDDEILELGAEVFKLPIVSVWAEYKAASTSQKSCQGLEPEPSILVFNSTVHSSNNTLRPILLPFVTELVNHVESRMRKISLRTSRSPTAPLQLASSESLSRLEDEESVVMDSFSSLQICFSLRIDKSKLELTCQPDVNVVAGLHWESGGFVMNISPGARKISFFGAVGGLTIGLKHGFLSEDCVKLDARNLSFSVSVQKLETGLGHSVSLVLDTEFLGGVRFSRLQDILCFKAVWLDRIPIFNSQSPVSLEKSTPTSLRPIHEETVDPRLQGKVSTIVLVRVRKIKLEVDLGQSISKLDLGLEDFVFRTNFVDDLKELFIYVGDVSLNATGNLSGNARVSSCMFQTIRRSETSLWTDLGRGKMLELRLTTGALTIYLQSDHQDLLLYRAQPLEIEVFDDWSGARSEDEFRSLQLSFTIGCSEIIASATVGTIPKILSYVNKFKANLDAQRQGASRESQTFRATRTPKPDNPLSAVAHAMLHSARSRFKEAEAGSSYIIRQHMSLRLDLLQLIVFPRTMRDAEVAQFIGRGVEAQLNGLVGADGLPGKRDLRLSFSSMTISRYTQVSQPPFHPQDGSKRQEYLDWPRSLFKDAVEAIIVGLPSMKMHMVSEEIIDEVGKTLVYDFDSQFVRREGMKAFEDIFITLNMSLYSWLTVLRKNLTRELDQVRATEDWRASMSNVSTAITAGGSQRKRKTPDPLSLTDTPRSATLPSEDSIRPSPFAPASARLASPDQYRSPLQTSREQSLLSPALSQPLTPFQFPAGRETPEETLTVQPTTNRPTITYKPRERHIERLTMRQLGEATPDVMHPFFMKKAGFNLEDSLPQYVNEYAVTPLEEIMEVLLKIYSQQLLTGVKKARTPTQS